jgi:hypothetical protein
MHELTWLHDFRMWSGSPISSSLTNCTQHARNQSEPSQQNIIACGQLAVVHQLSDKLVRKLPLDKSFYSEQAIQIEAQIYKHLGRHKRIARCHLCSSGHIDLRYERNGNLESYLQEHQVTERFRYRAAEQAVEAVDFILDLCLLLDSRAWQV